MIKEPGAQKHLVLSPAFFVNPCKESGASFQFLTLPEWIQLWGRSYSVISVYNLSSWLLYLFKFYIENGFLVNFAHTKMGQPNNSLVYPFVRRFMKVLMWKRISVDRNFLSSECINVLLSAFIHACNKSFPSIVIVIHWRQSRPRFPLWK